MRTILKLRWTIFIWHYHSLWRFSMCFSWIICCLADNWIESINPQNTMWCLPVGNPRRQHHHCASSTKAAPSLLPSTTRASSRWKAQAVYRLYTGVNFQIPIPTRRSCSPDHWAAGRRCQLPRIKTWMNKHYCAWTWVCLVWDQWQIRSFRAGEPGRCSRKWIIGSSYIQVCPGI